MHGLSDFIAACLQWLRILYENARRADAEGTPIKHELYHL